LKTLVTRFVGLALAVTVAWPLASQADDQERKKAWTSVGSTGTLSRVDLDRVTFTGPSLALAPTTTGSVVARYNVVATDALFSVLGERTGTLLKVVYRDPGAGATVTAALFRSSLIDSGGTSQLVAFSSESFPQAPGIQENSVSTCVPHSFEFEHRAYHVEVTLTRAVGGPIPLLRAIQVTTVPCIL